MRAGSSAAGSACSEAAPNGAPRPCLQVPNDGRGLGEQRRGSRNPLVPLEGLLPHERTQSKPPHLLPHAPKPRHAIEIHHDGRPNQPHVHHGHQTLPPSQHLGIPAMKSKELDHLVNRPWRKVIKGSRPHEATSHPRSRGRRAAFRQRSRHGAGMGRRGVSPRDRCFCRLPKAKAPISWPRASGEGDRESACPAGRPPAGPIPALCRHAFDEEIATLDTPKLRDGRTAATARPTAPCARGSC